MIRYIGRRLLQMIPTLLGVLVITFVLFNVVGGSPASSALSKHATPQALDEFDELHGYNKPLLYGRWIKTRAFADVSFAKNAAGWGAVTGAVYVAPERGRAGHVRLAAQAQAPIPLAFALRPDTRHTWTLRYRLAGSQPAWLVVTEAAGSNLVRRRSLPVPPAAQWRSATLEISTPPSNSVASFALRTGAAPLELQSVQLRRGMRQPFDSQFAYFLWNVVRLDLGESVATQRRVADMIRSGVRPSLLLTVPIFFGGLALALVLALVCAFFRDRWIDRSLVVFAVALMSINYLVFIVAGQYWFSFRLGAFPVWGFESWHYLALPVLIGIVSGLGANVRFYRTIMLDEMYKDYVRTAFAKGLSTRAVLFKHVLKNAMIPVVTNAIIAISFLFTGSLLLESFFGIPGLGRMAVTAVNSSDPDSVRALVLIGAVIYMLANLLTDLCYALVDPRVRLK